MRPNRSRNKRSTRPIALHQEFNKQDLILDKIAESLAHQQTSSLPVVPDIKMNRIKGNKVYTFEQSFTSGIGGNNTTETDMAFSFSLNSIANATSLTNIFDTYRIIAVRAQFIPNETAQGSGGPVYTVIDYDDTSTTSLTAALQYDTLQVAPAGAFFERNFAPRVAVSAYAGTSFGSFAQLNNTWIDTASSSVAHYGLKAVVPPSPNPPLWTILFTLTFQFRNTR